jgi:hypothetical protein
MKEPCLLEIFPEECMAYGYKVVGYAYQLVLAGNVQTQEIRIMTRQLLMDQEKRIEIALLVDKLADDPWIKSIEAFLEAG